MGPDDFDNESDPDTERAYQRAADLEQLQQENALFPWLADDF